MILNRSNFLFAIVVVMIAMVSASCVDIPDKAPDPPALNAEFRFISIAKDGFTTPSSILMAEGPNFTTYKSYTLGANAVPTNYTTFLSGSKRIVYFNGVVNDTLRLTFDTDQRGTIVFSRNAKPDTDTSSLVDALKLPYRYTFAPNGVQDSALVRFTNFVQNSHPQIDVYRSDSTFATSVLSVNNLAFNTTSAAIRVPVGRNFRFFFSRYYDPALTDVNRVSKDSVFIPGGSRKVYTVFIYDTFDSTAAPALRNAKVKVKVLEEL